MSFRRDFLINFLWWFVFIYMWMLFIDTDFQHAHGDELEHKHSFRTSFSIIMSLVMTVLNTTADWLWNKRGYQYRVSFRKKLLMLLGQQFLFILTAALIIYGIASSYVTMPDSGFEAFSQRFNVFGFWVYAGTVAYILMVIKEIDKKLGPGNLWKIITGRFSKPREMPRIFMFLDLANATTHAEKLGNIRYSELLQDCFHDVSIVGKYRAEVFQYVGDEVVLVWTEKNGFEKMNCIQAYYAFMDRLSSKSEYYLKKYGFVPHFRAGLHYGIVVLAEVGEIKRDIAYHGDTINTTSRIQGQCRVLNEEFLISSSLVVAVGNETVTKNYNLLDKGSIALKGKDKTVHLYGISRKSKSSNTPAPEAISL